MEELLIVMKEISLSLKEISLKLDKMMIKNNMPQKNIDTDVAKKIEAMKQQHKERFEKLKSESQNNK